MHCNKGRDISGLNVLILLVSPRHGSCVVGMVGVVGLVVVELVDISSVVVVSGIVVVVVEGRGVV